ncbi:release factor H-coupled R [Mycena maculata]|uniref:3'-phosphate/5'-hydroxy nucleic acid ligase n=1 Tax=Mycena maculata TaxID=230809 RepID=A0AAD7K0N2_9AGAR|nr:release factor H-coupled R [Mycena maculata]
MPSRVVTVTLNYNQSKKFALLLLPSSQPDHDRDTILREARNKFRVKVSSVFLPGGITLSEGERLPQLVSQIWVAKGEPYAGPPGGADESSASFDAELVLIRCVLSAPVMWRWTIIMGLSGKSYLDDKAIEQLKLVGRLPGVLRVVGLPDLHPGSRFPIGCAIAAEGIWPALIGSDVGCGIALYELSARPKSTLNPTKLALALRGLEEPWAGDVSAWLSNYGITRVSAFDAGSLGTVGAGNHFAEICTVERIVDETVAVQLGVLADGLYLLVHTGSRGLGAFILSAETATNSNPYIEPESPHLPEYLNEHDYAVCWAVANRDLVAHRIQQCIMPSTPEGGPRLRLSKILDVTHNSVTKHALSIGDTTRDLWVHRKGAAPADQGIAPCPGSRGDFSWLLQPTGDGQNNARSLAHGAGRRYGRNVLHTGSKINKASLTNTDLGSVVICEDPDLLIEEQPEAYKDVACVVEDMEDNGICKGVVVLRPVVTYKVRRER